MSNTRDTGFLRNAIQVTDQGVTFVSGSTTLMSISSSGAVTTTGVISGSNALSASFSLNSALLNGIGSVGFATTGALLEVSSSQQQISSSQQQISASLLNVVANYATTGSNSFRANQSITGSLVVSSTITAQTLVVQTVTSSIVYSSGSNVFGNQLANTQTFTGSFNITGSSHSILGSLNLNTTASITNVVLNIQSLSNSAGIIINNSNSGAYTGFRIYNDQVSANRALEIDYAGSTYGGALVSSGIAGESAAIVTTGAYPLQFGTSNTFRMCILSGGNVGIGTTQPGYMLDVAGTGRFTGQLIASSTSGGTAAIFQNTGVQNSNGIELRGGTTGTAVNWKLEKDNTVSNAFQLTPSTTNGGSTYTTPALTITSTGAATFSSSITAGGNLNLQGAVTRNINFYDSSNTNINAQIQYDQISSTSGQLFFGTNNAGTFATRLTIANTGVATFSNRVVASNSAAGAATISTSNANNTDDAGMTNLNFDGNRLRLGVLPSDSAYGCIGSSGAANTGLAFVTHNGVGWGERMRILTTGNVGIGMTTAPSKLSVDGSLQVSGTITNLGTGTGTYTQTTWYIDTNNQILFENARITDSASGTGRTVYFTWRGGPGYGGGVQLQHGANAWAAYTSDARMKTKVADVVNGLDAIMKLSPIKFKWTRELENSRTVTGFTAQNVGEAIPEAIFNSWKDDELGDVKSYYQDYLVPYLVKAIQELKLENDSLKEILQRNNIN